MTPEPEYAEFAVRYTALNGAVNTLIVLARDAEEAARESVRGLGHVGAISVWELSSPRQFGSAVVPL